MALHWHKRTGRALFEVGIARDRATVVPWTGKQAISTTDCKPWSSFRYLWSVAGRFKWGRASVRTPDSSCFEAKVSSHFRKAEFLEERGPSSLFGYAVTHTKHNRRSSWYWNQRFGYRRQYCFVFWDSIFWALTCFKLMIFWPEPPQFKNWTSVW